MLLGQIPDTGYPDFSKDNSCLSFKREKRFIHLLFPALPIV